MGSALAMAIMASELAMRPMTPATAATMMLRMVNMMGVLLSATATAIAPAGGALGSLVSSKQRDGKRDAAFQIRRG